MDTLILTSDLCVWNGAHKGVTGRQRMFTPPRNLIPPLVYLKVSVCPSLKFVFPTELMRLLNDRYFSEMPLINMDAGKCDIY
jgi:hypothetical protein